MTPDLKQKETQTIEEAFEELDGIVEQLERADVSLVIFDLSDWHETA